MRTEASKSFERGLDEEGKRGWVKEEEVGDGVEVEGDGWCLRTREGGRRVWSMGDDGW